MNLGIRAVLHTRRGKWKKTLLLFSLLLCHHHFGVVRPGHSRRPGGTGRGSPGHHRGQLHRGDATYLRAVGPAAMAVLIARRNLSSDEMLQEISSVDGVAGYDAALVAMPGYYNETGEALVNGNVINSYYTYGSINTEYNQLFSSGRFELVEGSHITENVKNGLIISKENAERNGLKIGDKITGINDPNNNDPEVDMEIVGLFDVVADKEDEADMYDAATLWDYTDYAFCSFNAMKEMAVNYEDGNKLTEAHFFVEDAAQLENVIAEVQNISSINWDHFIITANDEVYQSISSALSDTGTLVTTLDCSHHG